MWRVRQLLQTGFRWGLPADLMVRLLWDVLCLHARVWVVRVHCRFQSRQTSCGWLPLHALLLLKVAGNVLRLGVRLQLLQRVCQLAPQLEVALLQLRAPCL